MANITIALLQLDRWVSFLRKQESSFSKVWIPHQVRNDNSSTQMRQNTISNKTFFFAGGGTGGHIYPAIAVAEKIIELQPNSTIHFFISSSKIGSKILEQTDFEYTCLPALRFSIKPNKLFCFVKSFFKSYKIAKQIISKAEKSVVIGTGGFVAVPVCVVARKMKIPIAAINVDIVPGRANKIICRWANEIFVQFEDTKKYFVKNAATVNVFGCPLRSGFDNPQANKAFEQLKLEKNKKILLVTGASSGAVNVNKIICSLLEKLNGFAVNWQIVHLTGRANFENVNAKYIDAEINYKLLDYYDNMPDLLNAAALVIGRSGAVSVAEYAAAVLPAICIPYPYHKDKHQYLNAAKLVEAGAAVIVDDLAIDANSAEFLWLKLNPLMENQNQLQQMKTNYAAIANTNAALQIAENLLGNLCCS